MKKEYLLPFTEVVVLALNECMLGGDEVIKFSNVQEVSHGEVNAKEYSDFHDFNYDIFENDTYQYTESYNIWEE